MKIAAIVCLALIVAVISIVVVAADTKNDTNDKTDNKNNKNENKNDAKTSSSVVLYAGTYTKSEPWVNGTGKGIHAFTFDAASGALTPLFVLSSDEVGTNPTFLTGQRLPPTNQSVVYAINEVGVPSSVNQSVSTGFVVALTVHANGSLSVLNRQETMGSGSAHVSFNYDKTFLTVSNYNGGSVSLFPIDPKDGGIGPLSDLHAYPGPGSRVVPSRQEASHMHSATWVADSDLVVAADLGNDRLVPFQLNSSTKTLVQQPFIKTAPGAGPRHMAIHLNQATVYVLNELDSTVAVYASDGKPIQTISTLPPSFDKKKNTAAEIAVSLDGRFVYASNRGHDSIAVFKVMDDMKLQLVETKSTNGQTPRHFICYREFLIVANQVSNDLQVFKMDAETGKLLVTGKSIDCPSCVSLWIVD